MEDLKPLEWLNNISIVESEQKPITVVVSSKKKKLSLEYLLKNFSLIVNQFKSPSRRPTFSYATLILLSLHFTPSKKCSLSQIYTWIRCTFPYYSNGSTSPAWKNSIRHNLSLNKCFVKVPRDNTRDKPGKGGYWKLDECCERKLMEGDNFYRLRKKRNKKKGTGSGAGLGSGVLSPGGNRKPAAKSIEEDPVESPSVHTHYETSPSEHLHPLPVKGQSQSQSPEELYTIPPPFEEEIVIETTSAGPCGANMEVFTESEITNYAAAAAPVERSSDLNELNIVLEEYYYDPSNGCFEELELDIEHLISIGGF